MNLSFNIDLGIAIRRAVVRRNDAIVYRSHMLLDFAGDINIIGIDRQAVDTNVLFNRETAMIGPTINSIKTKYMIADKQRVSNCEVLLGSEQLLVVDVTRDGKSCLAAANKECLLIKKKNHAP